VPAASVGLFTVARNESRNDKVTPGRVSLINTATNDVTRTITGESERESVTFAY
jgi:hypothetical protein